MNWTKQDMIRLLRKMGETRRAVDWVKKRNEELYAALQSLTIPSLQPNGDGRSYSVADSVRQMILQREKIEEEIKENKKVIEDRLQEYAAFTRMMTEVLTEDEKNVLWNRHAERMTWDRVARVTRMSRSSCFRAEATGIEALRKAWEKAQKTKDKESEKKEGML